MFQKMIDDLCERRKTAKHEKQQPVYCHLCDLEVRSWVDELAPNPTPMSEALCYPCRIMVSKGFDPKTGRFPDKWFTPDGEIEFSQTLTGEQATIFEKLLKIECRKKVKGDETCNGEWCTIRRQLATAFGVKIVESETEDHVDN